MNVKIDRSAIGDTRIIYDVVPNEEQGYNTVGDYWKDEKGVRRIRVSKMDYEAEETAIFIHEVIESALCRIAGITDEAIDAFDVWYQENKGPDDPDEPGDHPDCPYYAQHQTASLHERLFIQEAGLVWHVYDGKIVQMTKDRDKSGQDD